MADIVINGVNPPQAYNSGSLNLADYKDPILAYSSGTLDQSLVGAAAVQPAPLPVAAGEGPRKIVRRGTTFVDEATGKMLAIPPEVLKDLGWKSPSLANPGPVGLFCFGMGTIGIALYGTGAIPPPYMHQFMTAGFFIPGLGQFIAGMWELSFRNVFSAVAFSLFGLNWMAMGLWDFFTLFQPALAIGMSPGGSCFWNILWAIFAFILATGSLWINKALTGTLILVGVGKFLEGIGAFVPVLGNVGSGFLFVSGICALYMGFAEMINDIEGKDTFPLWPWKRGNEVGEKLE